MNNREKLMDLVAVARGDKPADLVLDGGKVVDVFTGRIEETRLAVHKGAIAGIGDYQGRDILDVSGLYLCPGFIEGHMHVESTMLSPAGLAEVICPHGTALVAADPHEIANVMGADGVRAMLEASKDLPVDFLYNAPSCVPATHLETAGACLDAKELAKLKELKGVLGLAEVMNFPGVVAGDGEVLDKILAFEGRPIDGHAPMLGGKALNAYLAAGPDSDHECSGFAEAQERLARGMWLMIRQGTSAHNMEALLPLVTPLTERRCMLVTDDRHPDELAALGHLDYLARLAVEKGLDPITALRMVSINPARRFGLYRRGALAPGYQADICAVEDLSQFKVRMVIHKGVLAAKDGGLINRVEDSFPASAKDTMRAPELTRETFRVKAMKPKVRAIKLVPGELITAEALLEAPKVDGLLAADPKRDLALLTVIERHGINGSFSHGLLKGFGLEKGAVASSVAHDSHNLIVAGMDEDSMLSAALKVVDMKGGIAIALGQEVLAGLPLPLAGLMSDEPIERVLKGLEELRTAAGRICTRKEPFMLLSFMALPVIPKLRLTDQGLVDVEQFGFVDLFVD